MTFDKKQHTTSSVISQVTRTCTDTQASHSSEATWNDCYQNQLHSSEHLQELSTARLCRPACDTADVSILVGEIRAAVRPFCVVASTAIGLPW